MAKKQKSIRAIKKKVIELLKRPDLLPALEELSSIPFRRVVNPLFSFLYNKEPLIKWNAVTAMGFIVSKLAHEDMEAARVVMRRLMWNLNDESGGIGWGSPEAMGEILSVHKGLADEYSTILLSYARKDGNFQENEIIQRGVLWGIGRLAQTNPELLKGAVPHIILFLQSPDPAVRGLAVWALGLLGADEASMLIETLSDDENPVQIYLDHDIIECRVKDLAVEALKRLA